MSRADPDDAQDDDIDKPVAVGAVVAGFTRYLLPTIIAVLGLVLIVVGHGSYSNLATARSLESATGVALLIVAVIVWMINWLYRLGLSSNRDREEEERARDHFTRTGRWPEDEPR